MCPRAARKRSSVRSRPSTTSDSKSGGPTVRPVDGDTDGRLCLPELEAVALAPPSRARPSASRHPRARPRRRRSSRRARLAASAAFIALSHDAGSVCGSSRNKKSTIAGTSARRVTRVCTRGAIDSNAARSKRSGCHGACGATSHGWHAIDELLGRHRSDVLAVERLELLHVEVRGRGVHVFEAPQLGELLERHDLAVVGRRPPEQHQEVLHRLGQVALVAVQLERDRIAALRELLALLVHEERARARTPAGRRRRGPATAGSPSGCWAGAPRPG